MKAVKKLCLIYINGIVNCFEGKLKKKQIKVGNKTQRVVNICDRKFVQKHEVIWGIFQKNWMNQKNEKFEKENKFVKNFELRIFFQSEYFFNYW